MFAPALSFIDEASTPGMIGELETDEQMLDTAIGAAIDVFTAGNDIGANPDSSAFIEVDWQQPARTPCRVRATATTAAHMAATVEHTVKLGRVDPGQTPGLAVGDRVQIDAIMKIETTPGGNAKTSYMAQNCERLHPPV